MANVSQPLTMPAVMAVGAPEVLLLIQLGQPASGTSGQPIGLLLILTKAS